MPFVWSLSPSGKKQGHFIEVQVTDGALYRTKIHCDFLDQTRVVRPQAQEKNYHICYQMLAGLTPEERSRLSLEGYSVHNLRYLNRGDTRCNEAEDARRFAAWKACLGEWTREPSASRRGFFFFFFLPIRRVRPDVWLLLEIWIEGRPLRNMRQSS